MGADDTGTLHFIDPAFHEDAAVTRASTEKLLDLPFEILCLDHGAPVADDPKAAIRNALSAP